MRILPLNGSLYWITSKSTWQYKFPDCLQARLPALDCRKALAHTKPKCPSPYRHPVLGRLNSEENLSSISKNNISLLILLCQNKLLVFSLYKDSNSIAIGNSAALNLKIHSINPIKNHRGAENRVLFLYTSGTWPGNFHVVTGRWTRWPRLYVFSSLSKIAMVP